MNRNSSYVLGLIALIMVSVSCVFFVFYRAGGGRESRSKTVRYAGCLGKLLFAASVILLSVSILNGFAKGEGFRENLEELAPKAELLPTCGVGEYLELGCLNWTDWPKAEHPRTLPTATAFCCPKNITLRCQSYHSRSHGSNPSVTSSTGWWTTPTALGRNMAPAGLALKKNEVVQYSNIKDGDGTMNPILFRSGDNPAYSAAVMFGCGEQW